MFDRQKIVQAFREALVELKSRCESECLHPHAVAVKAHALYASRISPRAKQPSPATFKRYVSGKGALPEVVEVLRQGEVNPAARAPLCRDKVLDAFRKAAEALQPRIRRGTARALHIADRAHKIYTQQAVCCGPTPSRHSFRRLVYGITADPEIAAWIKRILPGR